MRYVPYGELAGRPHVMVDGSAADGTTLVLSHWPGSPTPLELAADLSTEIALRYVERPDLHVAADVASNDHVDEDVRMCARRRSHGAIPGSRKARCRHR